jgi:hypothetical protein
MHAETATIGGKKLQCERVFIWAAGEVVGDA